MNQEADLDLRPRMVRARLADQRVKHGEPAVLRHQPPLVQEAVRGEIAVVTAADRCLVRRAIPRDRARNLPCGSN